MCRSSSPGRPGADWSRWRCPRRASSRGRKRGGSEEQDYCEDPKDPFHLVPPLGTWWNIGICYLICRWGEESFRKGGNCPGPGGDPQLLRLFGEAVEPFPVPDGNDLVRFSVED